MVTNKQLYIYKIFKNIPLYLKNGYKYTIILMTWFQINSYIHIIIANKRPYL